MEQNFELAIGRYRCYYNRETKKYDVWSVIGKYIISCTQLSACKSVMNALNAEDEIMMEVNRLNNIEEPERDRNKSKKKPANDNSILNTPIAKMTRELLGKTK